ncbi:hypothetical protein [Sphaerisporangium rubeum]|uniref:Uncharacterized protein n=1 Tax=Sphaerisporangium rubeum TaxID=321317 RepID=A0A7X0M5B6_9ACTN|nr:hypothetical protein [Sphaerisporangium rubeum]MBB6472473.1 hypothetical protein [Sphaerisporangium rubeum]
MSNGVGGKYGTKAVPTYVLAEAETAPLPRITIEEPPPAQAPPAARSFSFRPSRFGDVPMRVIYRTVAGVGAAVAVTAAVAAFMVSRPDDSPAAAPAPAGTLISPLVALPSASASGDSPSVSPAASPEAGVPLASPLASLSTPPSAVATSTPGGPAGSVVATGQASPAATDPSPVATPGRTALELAEADPRVPAMPDERKLANFPGKGGATKGVVKDKRSGISFARFAKQWKLTKSSPFATRRVLPAVKGAGQRGLLATCPVPILVQKELKDTAYLAARWTLNHHPDGSMITWTASQPFKAGKRDGWLLGYRVTYQVKGHTRHSTAAVALVDVPKAKPALVFITIPEAQKKRYADINTLVSSIRAL